MLIIYAVWIITSQRVRNDLITFTCGIPIFSTSKGKGKIGSNNQEVGEIRCKIQCSTERRGTSFDSSYREVWGIGGFSLKLSLTLVFLNMLLGRLSYLNLQKSSKSKQQTSNRDETTDSRWDNPAFSLIQPIQPPTATSIFVSFVTWSTFLTERERRQSRTGLASRERKIKTINYSRSD